VKALTAWSDDAGAVTWIERDAKGRVLTRSSAGHAVTFLRMADASRELMRSLRSSRAISSVSQEEQWLRIVWRSVHLRRTACERDGWFARNNIETFEGDVPAVRRWAIDTNVEIQRPRLVYLDIETCARHPMSEKERHRVLCWTLVAADDGRTISGVLEEDTDAAEAELLVALWDALGEFDQVAAWNGDGFDFPVIFARSAARNLRVDARRWLWLDHLELFRRMNTSAESGDEKQSMALQSVAMAVLGEGKLPGFDHTRMFPAWAAGGEDRAALLAYNVHDVRLMRRIEQATGYIELLYTLCDATGTFPDTHGMKPMPQVETFVMRLGCTEGVHFPTKWRREDGYESEGAFRGAFVMDPTRKGIVSETVHVADFSAMYPSIVQSWNMSPETLLPAVEAPSFPAYLSHLAREWKPPPRPEYAAESATGCQFDQRKRGLLPRTLDVAIALRKKWNDLKATLPPNTPEWVEADRRSTAYKVFANSVFGVVSAEMSRLHTRDVGESITQTGVMLIRLTMKAAQDRGLSVIYGDTDSLFVTGCTDEEFKSFVQWCNATLYPAALVECGCVENRVKLAYEKAFERVVFVSAKRYIARWAHYKGSLPDERTKPEVKGIEYKRGDSCRLTRWMQAEIIDLLMGGGINRPRAEHCEDDPAVYRALVERWRERVLVAPVELDDVVLSKRLTKPLKEYVVKKKKDGDDAASPPHVRVARVLAERGSEMGEGARVAYFVADGTAKPVQVVPAADWTGECDRFAVWEDQVWEPSARLLAAALPAELWKGYAKARPAAPRRGGPGASMRLPGVAGGVAPGNAPAAPPVAQLGLFSLPTASPRARRATVRGGGSTR
jgi:DNA polymerase elongation subunit (family B)